MRSGLGSASGKGGANGSRWKSPSECIADGGYGPHSLGARVYGCDKRVVLAHAAFQDHYRSKYSPQVATFADKPAAKPIRRHAKVSRRRRLRRTSLAARVFRPTS